MFKIKALASGETYLSSLVDSSFSYGLSPMLTHGEEISLSLFLFLCIHKSYQIRTPFL